MTIYDLINKNDTMIESQILQKILITKKIPLGLQSDFFTGLRKPLFIAITEQQKKFGTIDREILSNSHAEIYENLKKIGPASSAIAIDILYKNWLIREVARNACAAELTEETIIDSIQKLQLNLSNIIHKNSNDIYDHSAVIKSILENIEAGHKSEKKLLGYTTKLSALDSLSNGLEKGKVYALGALKKCGKSRFAVYLSLILKNQGLLVYWNSLEMSKEQLNLLALSYYSGINSNMLGKKLTYKDYDQLLIGSDYLKQLDWIIYKDHTVYDLKSRLLSCKVMPDVVIIDFIQRMRSDKYKGDRTREIENIAQDIADLTRDLNICTIELSQLQGAAEKLEPNEIPNMSHFKESQAIPENADQIWSLHNPKRHEDAYVNGVYVPQKFQMRIEQRYDVSGCYCEFIGDMRTCAFRDIETGDNF
jgi:replicative DNA helicase